MTLLSKRSLSTTIASLHGYGQLYARSPLCWLQSKRSNISQIYKTDGQQIHWTYFALDNLGAAGLICLQVQYAHINYYKYISSTIHNKRTWDMTWNTCWKLLIWTDFSKSIISPVCPPVTQHSICCHCKMYVKVKCLPEPQIIIVGTFCLVKMARFFVRNIGRTIDNRTSINATKLVQTIRRTE